MREYLLFSRFLSLANQTSYSFYSRKAILSRILLLSTIQLGFSGPRAPFPPVSREKAMFGLRKTWPVIYRSWASSTWIFASLVLGPSSGKCQE